MINTNEEFIGENRPNNSSTDSGYGADRDIGNISQSFIADSHNDSIQLIDEIISRNNTFMGEPHFISVPHNYIQRREEKLINRINAYAAIFKNLKNNLESCNESILACAEQLEWIYKDYTYLSPNVDKIATCYRNFATDIASKINAIDTINNTIHFNNEVWKLVSSLNDDDFFNHLNKEKQLAAEAFDTIDESKISEAFTVDCMRLDAINYCMNIFSKTSYIISQINNQPFTSNSFLYKQKIQQTLEDCEKIKNNLEGVERPTKKYLEKILPQLQAAHDSCSRKVSAFKEQTIQTTYTNDNATINTRAEKKMPSDFHLCRNLTVI